MKCYRVQPGLVVASVLLACVASPAMVEGQDRKGTLSAVVTIGSMDGPDALTVVPALTIVDGFIWVTQPEESAVKLFSLNGAPAGEIGRRGNGPGEFQAPSTLMSDGEHVGIRDTGAGRITVYNRDGSFAWSARTERGYPAGILGPGTWWETSIVASGTERIANIVVTDLETEASQVAFSIGSLPPPVVVSVGTGATSFRRTIPQPFDDSDLFMVDSRNRRFVLVKRDETVGQGQWSVLLINPVGDTIATRTYRTRSIPLTEQRVDAFVAELIDGIHDRQRQNGLALSSIDEANVRGQLRRNRSLPAIRDVLMGYDSTMWLRLWTEREDSAQWIGLRDQGDIIGYVHVSTAERVVAASMDMLWTTHRGELDTPRITGYEIQW